MKNSLRGHRHIHNLRVLHPHDRQKHALHRMAHIEVLLRRRPHYRGQINRLFAACHALHMKDGKLPFERIKTGVIAKWSFGACFVQVHEALEHDFRVRRDLQVVGLAGNHFHRLAPQKSSEHHFVKIGRDWQHSRQRRRRVRPNGHAHRNPPCGILRSRAAKMLCSVLLRLPVHTRGPLVIHLHAIHSNVSLARLGILRKHQRERDKAPSILRPCLQDRKIKQIDVGSLSNDFLARAILDALGEKRPQFRQLWQHLDFVKEPLWRLHLEKALNPLRHLVQLPHLEGQLHTSHAAECIDQHGHARAFRVLKQQRHIRQNLPPCLWRSPWSEAACARLRPAHPLHDFRNLQHRVHFRANAPQLPFLLELPHKLPQIPIRHFSLRFERNPRASTLARTPAHSLDALGIRGHTTSVCWALLSCSSRKSRAATTCYAGFALLGFRLIPCRPPRLLPSRYPGRNILIGGFPCASISITTPPLPWTRPSAMPCCPFCSPISAMPLLSTRPASRPAPPSKPRVSKSPRSAEPSPRRSSSPAAAPNRITTLSSVVFLRLPP